MDMRKILLNSLPPRELLRVDEVAHFFQVTRRTVYNWYNSDRLQGVHLRGVLRIYRDSVIKLIMACDGKKTGIDLKP